MTEQEWVIEAVKFYRPMDFFTGFSELSDEELADELISQRKKVHTRSYLEAFLEAKEEALKDHEPWEMVEPEAIADMALIAQDKSRIWWEDGEMDPAPSNNTYVEFLQQCSRISRGAFNPTNIEEKWDGYTLETVSFDFKDERWEATPIEWNGWLDFGMLDGVNSIIEESGYRFLGHWAGDQTMYIVVLTEQEKQKFESERTWSFYDSFHRGFWGGDDDN